MDGGGGGGEKGGLYLRLSAQFGEAGGGKRGEGVGMMRWSERNTRTKKETQASTSVRVTFFLSCTGLEPRRIIMEEGDLLQGA